MSETAENTKWKIPYGITYEKFVKMIKILLQKKADLNYVNIDSVINIIGLPDNFLKSNLSFFKAIGVIECNNSQGYKFTSLGNSYAKALSLDKKEDIEKNSKEIISKSYLNDLKVVIETEGNNITLDKLFRVIKTNAKISDGENAGNMPVNSSTGAYALLHFFKNAKLINDDVLKTTPVAKESVPKSKKSRESSSTSKAEESFGSDDFSLKSNKFAIMVKNGVSLDELDFIKGQVNSLFEYVKKKIEQGNN